MRVLVVHGDLAARGGAEAYCSAVLAALARLGIRPDLLDIDGLRPCGNGEPARKALLLRLGRLPFLRDFHLWKYALVCRVLARVARGYDRVILSYGEGPALPVPTLEIRHAPALFSTARHDLEALGAAQRGALHLLARRLYATLLRMIAGVAPRPAQRAPVHRVVANSHWTAARLPAGLGPVTVVHPPVPRRAPLPAPRKPFGVVTLGRLVRTKRLEDAIAVVSALRARGLPAELDIVGRAEGRYARTLMHRHRERDWLRFHTDAEDAKLAEILARARFGLHCCHTEHFGIAVAEMIQSGVVPVVRADGGICELVPEPALQFAHPAEACDRLADLMARPLHETDAISRRLQAGAALRAALRFETEMTRILTDFLEARA